MDIDNIDLMQENEPILFDSRERDNFLLVDEEDLYDVVILDGISAQW